MIKSLKRCHDKSKGTLSIELRTCDPIESMKRTIDDLAIFGGRPLFDEPLHVGRPNIGDRQRLLERFGSIIDSRWLTNDGPVVHEFESRIAEFVGVRNCVAMCNATVAMEIAIRASGLTGEVIIPSFTFIATAHALQWQEITPCFVTSIPQLTTLTSPASRS